MSMPELSQQPQSCTTKFVTEPGYIWYCGMTMHLAEVVFEQSYNGISLVRKKGESQIILPHDRTFDILIELEAKNDTLSPATFDVEFRSTNREKKSIRQKTTECDVKISHRIRYETPKDETDNVMVIKLSAPEYLTHVRSNVFITIRRN